MQRVFVGLFVVIVLSSFVFAASSEIAADFNVDVPTGEVLKSVAPETFVGDYLGYAVLFAIVLILIYFSSKKKRPKKRKASKKKRSKKKKTSKSKK